MMKSVSLLALLFTSCAGFSSAPVTKVTLSKNVAAMPLARSKISFSTHTTRTTTVYATNLDSEEQSDGGFLADVTFNPPYLVAYISFLLFAFFRTFTEEPGASNDILQAFIADPLHPGCNEIFFAIFNLLGLYFVPMSCLLMPGSNENQKFPAAPFLIGSALGGYGLLGPYAFTRKPDLSLKTKADLGWVTANVLENKIFNWFIVVALVNAYLSSNVLSVLLSDASGTISGFGQLFSDTAIASASSMDFVILTIAAASFIPEDLSRRGYKGESASLIAASTLLWPGVGVALYCALRPSLDEE